MNIGFPELVIVLLILGFMVLPIAILVVVLRNTRRPPIHSSNDGEIDPHVQG